MRLVALPGQMMINDCLHKTLLRSFILTRVAVGWRAEIVAEAIPQPWSIACLPDGRARITGKAGKLYILNRKRLDAVLLERLPPVFASGQGGLLDIALHPADKLNRYPGCVPRQKPGLQVKKRAADVHREPEPEERHCAIDEVARAGGQRTNGLVRRAIQFL